VMYGFTPQKVPIYCLSAYKDTDKETLAAWVKTPLIARN
jgi:hypothetical protein